MDKIVSILKNDPSSQVLKLGRGNIVVNTIYDEALLLASAFLSCPKNMIVVKPNQYEANELYHELAQLLPLDTLYFPVDESFRVEALAASPELLQERIHTMYQLTNDKPHLLITHLHGLVRYVPTKNIFLDNCIHLKVGMTIDIFKLRTFLLHAGYQLESKVTEPFQYSKRGGIIDVYSQQYTTPIRIEFFDDEIDDIRFFDPTTQRTLDHVKEVTIIPASDVLYDDKQVDRVLPIIDENMNHHLQTLEEQYQDDLISQVEIDKEALRNHDVSFQMYRYFSFFDHVCSIKDYMDDAVMILASRSDLDFQYRTYQEENFYYYKELEDIGKTLKGSSYYQEFFKLIPRSYIDFKDFVEEKRDITFHSREVALNSGNEIVLVKQLKDYLLLSNILCCLESQHQIDLMIEVCARHDIPYHYVKTTNHLYDGINFYVGKLRRGIELVDHKVVIVTASELFKTRIQKRKKYFRYKEARILKDYQELHPGDYVVHDNYGIGQYLGIKTMEVQGYHRDYLHVAYAGNDTLYIPVEQFKLIRKYAGTEGKSPKIHKIGSSQWQKTKLKIKARADDIAEKLIEIYAARLKQPGFAFEVDNDLQIQFEQDFPYTLTRDQERCINEIKQDMEKPIPMDRLLCGDVGFGKTEVALRAAFKAILSNKQVAFLCPTTILSMQHYRTMEERFKNFPVTIALLNRFTPTKKRKQILQDVKEGKIDLLVGTHRILSKDVKFLDLGLLCIDEEQRFGVRQKEQIKEYRKTIDVLTLTATPIPRTLQMSLMGIRGLSQIETPPKDRLPVQTYVVEKNRTLIKQVIERELARGGQVFYLYNRTSEIENVAYNIQSTIPNAKVGIGHGKMTRDEIEDVMYRFVEKEFNVLVCTTIIETGIDIPNANTIIVEDADHFGLSQLYQIKGRVGRSDRSAYAYLLYRPQKQMNEEATKRLKAIKEFTELGSGYKIAMRDLSIRGSGDILGGKQAGFIDSVGFDMFMKILQDSLLEKQGKEVEEVKEEKHVSIHVDGYIPEDYVSSDMEKLELYQRLDEANTLIELEQLEDEFLDYYGKLPEEIHVLIEKRKLDIFSNSEEIDSIEDNKKQMQITLSKDYCSKVQGDKLFEIANRLFEKPEFRFVQGKIMIALSKNKKWLQAINQFSATLPSLINDK